MTNCHKMLALYDKTVSIANKPSVHTFASARPSIKFLTNVLLLSYSIMESMDTCFVGLSHS